MIDHRKCPYVTNLMCTDVQFETCHECSAYLTYNEKGEKATIDNALVKEWNKVIDERISELDKKSEETLNRNSKKLYQNTIGELGWLREQMSEQTENDEGKEVIKEGQVLALRQGIESQHKTNFKEKQMSEKLEKEAEKFNEVINDVNEILDESEENKKEVGSVRTNDEEESIYREYKMEVIYDSECMDEDNHVDDTVSSFKERKELERKAQELLKREGDLRRSYFYNESRKDIDTILDDMIKQAQVILDELQAYNNHYPLKDKSYAYIFDLYGRLVIGRKKRVINTLISTIE